MTPYDQCVIANPNAGSAEMLEQGLAQLGPHTLLKTTEAGEAVELARQAVADGFSRVIAAGGDGTINEVLNGLADGFGRVQLGVLPLGTANDFARSIGMPDDFDAALEMLRRGQARKTDVVQITSCSAPSPHYLINVSAGGFSTLVDDKLDDATKQLWGALGYAFSAVKALPDLEAYRVQLAFDDEPPLAAAIYNLVVANGRFVGGNIPVAPRALLNDGLFDVIVFREVPLTRLTTLVPKAMLGQHLDDEDVLFRQVRRLQISSQQPFELNADGEVIGHCPATFEVLPAALDVIVGTGETLAF